MADDGPTISAKTKERVVHSVTYNPVTIIVGKTGTGKSTLIPSLLLDELPQCRLKPVLCSQPRRLAVVAISKRVQELRNRSAKAKAVATATANNTRLDLSESSTRVGEVGYHVGNQNLSTKHTRLLFTTAGILLEDLRSNGMMTLLKYGCIIIDECHERSAESDLVLALIKQFLLTCKQQKDREAVRLILMSATFDSNRYKRFFADIPGCSKIDILNLETAQSFASFYDMVQDCYLSDIKRLLMENGVVPPGANGIIKAIAKDPLADLAFKRGKELSSNIIALVHLLVKALHKEEPNGAPFLIFAPTYRMLEQMYYALESIINLKLHVLHSSVDMDDCLRSMMPRKGEANGPEKESDGPQYRRVLLASAIAESSITVPGVTCVIDLCRSLQVRWQPDEVTYTPQTVWASKSICVQRRGRTGRTCGGRVFRVLPQTFYMQTLKEWDVPQLTLSSCHNEILALVTSTSRSLVNPKATLQTTLDPPDEEIVSAAVQFLRGIGAVKQSASGAKSKVFIFGSNQNSDKNDLQKLSPTKYGMLLAALPLAVKDGTVALDGARIGLLYEALAMRAICNHKPYPILHYFGERERSLENLRSYYSLADPSDPMTVDLANLSAYMFWDANWNSKNRNRTLQKFVSWANGDSDADADDPETVWKWTEEMEEENIKWCKQYELNPTAVRSTAELLETTIHVFYKNQFEPAWLKATDATPIWRRPNSWKGERTFGRDMFQRIYKDPVAVCAALSAVCTNQVITASKIVHEMAGLPPPSYADMVESDSTTNVAACIHWLEGKCRYGVKCRFSHSTAASRPPCRFFQQGSCSKGKNCIYSHKSQKEEIQGETAQDLASPMQSLVPLLSQFDVFDGGVMAWFRQHFQKLLMLGEGDFKFTFALQRHGMRPRISTTYEPLDPGMLQFGFWDCIDSTRLHLDERVRGALPSINAFAFNFPYPHPAISESQGDDFFRGEHLIAQTFLSLSQLLETSSEQREFHLALALHADQFSRWNVLRYAWRSGWYLHYWSDLGVEMFTGYKPSQASNQPIQIDHSRIYTFRLNRSY